MVNKIILFICLTFATNAFAIDFVFLGKDKWTKSEICAKDVEGLSFNGENSCIINIASYADKQLVVPKDLTSRECNNYALISPITNEVTQVNLAFNVNDFQYLKDVFSKRYGNPTGADIHNKFQQKLWWEQIKTSPQMPHNAWVDDEPILFIYMHRSDPEKREQLGLLGNISDDCIEIRIVTQKMANAERDFLKYRSEQGKKQEVENEKRKINASKNL